MQTEVFLKQFEITDSLVEDSFSILREKKDSFYIGFPFNKRVSTSQDIVSLFRELGFSFTSSAKDSVESLNILQLGVFIIEGKNILPKKVSYLYSIPSGVI